MPASITFSTVSWSTPDGRTLFSDLDIAFGPERTGLVGRNGVGKTTLLKLVTGEAVPETGAVTVNGSIGVLGQTVQVDGDATIADLFGARAGLDLLARAEAGAARADELTLADWTLATRLAEALERAGLAADAQTPLAALSGGQRTRAGLAALIFSEPDFLILDEPTNNLDRDGRATVRDLLKRWRGGAIVVSHDRELLEDMDAIVEMTTLGAQRYGGGFSAYRARKALELSAAEHALADAERRVEAVERRAQATAEKKARRDAGGRRKAARGDMPRIVAGGLKMASEQTTGDNARLAERRRQQALSDAADAREKIEILQPLGVRLPPTGLPAGRTVLQFDRVSGGYDPANPVFRDLSFSMSGPERVAVTGPNGSGKTTVLAVATSALAPLSGTVHMQVPFAMLDQRVGLIDPALSIRENFRRLNPSSDENACRAALARFLFRADAALQMAGTLSGGQMLRAGLACVLGGLKPPQLLILDEPTNHLDLDSIAAVEAGLAAYDGALLVVSHDEAFLEAIGITRRIAMNGG